jgi:hypothetical protein
MTRSIHPTAGTIWLAVQHERRGPVVPLLTPVTSPLSDRPSAGGGDLAAWSRCAGNAQLPWVLVLPMAGRAPGGGDPGRGKPERVAGPGVHGERSLYRTNFAEVTQLASCCPGAQATEHARPPAPGQVYRLSIS